MATMQAPLQRWNVSATDFPEAGDATEKLVFLPLRGARAVG
jgi:hypothetical protein